MGYVRKKKVFNLSWGEGTELEGLHVRVRSIPLGQFMELAALAELKNMKTQGFTPDMKEKVDGLFEVFADALVSWDLEDEPAIEGDPPVPVPATLGGVMAQDFDFILEIILAWMDAVGSVGDPLAPRSTGGGQFPEGSIPMESLSPNPLGLPTPS